MVIIILDYYCPPSTSLYVHKWIYLYLFNKLIFFFFICFWKFIYFNFMFLDFFHYLKKKGGKLAKEHYIWLVYSYTHKFLKNLQLWILYVFPLLMGNSNSKSKYQADDFQHRCRVCDLHVLDLDLISGRVADSGGWEVLHFQALKLNHFSCWRITGEAPRLSTTWKDSSHQDSSHPNNKLKKEDITWGYNEKMSV